MRDLPASIDAQLATNEHTLARCVRINLRDGSVLAFCDHDEDLVVDGITYAAGGGLLIGDIDLAAGLDADNTEVRLPVSETLTRARVLGRRYNQAEVFVFDCDWTADTPEEAELLAGKITEGSLEGQMAVFEVRSAADLFNIVIGSILTPRCRADFGDEQCGVAKFDEPAVVLTVESSVRFTVDLGYDPGDSYFRFGEIEFTSGELEGVPPSEILQYDGSAGLLELIEPLPALPEVGDELNMRQGCSRLKSSSDPELPTCAYWANVTRFRGFDRVPGSDIYLRLPVPGAAGS